MTDSTPQPLTGKRTPGSLLIWMLPLAALSLVVWMAYQSMASKGQTIEIAFDDGQGLLPGKTLLLFKGIEVGKVDDAQLSGDPSQVIASVRLEKRIQGIAVEGSQFWITRPEISLAGVRGLDTILSGVYIEVEPGKGLPAHSFQGLPKAPILSGSKELRIVLLANKDS